MNIRVLALAFLLGTLPTPAQLPQTQEQFWQQVDEQMRRQEQERWAREMTEQAQLWEAQQAWEQEQEQIARSQPPPPDSMGILLRQSAAMAAQSRDILLDPQFEKFQRGFWEFHAVGDHYRSAMFVHPKGFLSVHGPGGSYQGALLMLWGPNIPAPPTLNVIPVTLQQNDEPPQKLRTFNYGFPGVSGWGTLIFVVPSARALIDNMEEVHHFKALINDQEVFSSGWHDGKAAAAKL